MKAYALDPGRLQTFKNKTLKENAGQRMISACVLIDITTL